MSITLKAAESRPAHTVATAALATVIALGLLSGVAMLFQSRGEPFERVAIAERACAQHAYRSEQQACVARWLAEHKETRVAKR